MAENDLLVHLDDRINEPTGLIRRAWNSVRNFGRKSLDDGVVHMDDRINEPTGLIRRAWNSVRNFGREALDDVVILEEDIASGATRGVTAKAFAPAAAAALGGGAVVAEVLDAYSEHAGSVDVKRHMTEAGVSSSAAVGVGLGTGGAISTAMGGGALGFGLATGGAAVGAVAAAAAAVKYAMGTADGAMYGADDARFSTDRATKTHMVGLAKFQVSRSAHGSQHRRSKPQ